MSAHRQDDQLRIWTEIVGQLSHISIAALIEAVSRRIEGDRMDLEMLRAHAALFGDPHPDLVEKMLRAQGEAAAATAVEVV